MGIKGFTKVFSAHKLISNSGKELEGMIVAIDVCSILHRACLGIRNLRGITDKDGNPTIHISVLLSYMIRLQENGVNQIWCFDYETDQYDRNNFHNVHKQKEMNLRHQRKDQAHTELKELVKKAIDTSGEEKKRAIAEVHRKQKQCFHVTKQHYDDIRFMLDCFGIAYVQAPKGYEGEALAARLTHKDVGLADAVLSADTDVPLFGAAIFIRQIPRNKKQWEMYYLDKMLREQEITMTQLIQGGVALGCDFYKDEEKVFRGIGPKTVFKKLKSGKLDEKFERADVKTAMQQFTQRCSIDDLTFVNKDVDAFSDQKSADQLLQWLVEKKQFRKDRMVKQLSRVYDHY